MGEWLAFCPEEDDDLMLDIADGKIPLSPVKVDGKRTLLNKFMKSLSATAIDSAVKLVEVSQTSQRKADFRNSKQDISKGNQKSYLVLLNLESMKPIMAFPVPGGCSHVSLSPYDMALTTTTMRGDEILMWDFSSFKSNVILVDRFKRGKTAGIIDQVVWASGNKSIGVLSRTGSIHWFVHLLNESSPNRKSWMIPGTGARTIGLAPKFEGEYGVNPRAAAGTVNSAPRVDRYGMMPDVAITDPTVKVETHQTNQYEYRVKTGESRLLVYCEDDTVKTIDTRTGEWEFTLPLLNARIMEQKCNIVFDFPSAVDLNRKRYAASRGTPQFGFDTLSQAEIDISPKSGAGTKLHIEFSTYAFDSNEENSRESFIRRLETMTCTSDAQPVNFGKASGVPIFSGTAPSIDPCDSGVLNLKTAIETDLKLS
ncbi:unnamed protein product [Kuraishia capsulata CBS 1993]|uniref:Uncharacterized protein n=1 Tax=Kuraishia capsulata CBS 1993 TaxID=1382522 RepID=W6MIC1_9ASCO|nr:uncharacterized protein KUCA_T00002170001 [Kuraishia capsulata CBS 1993]CDK26199.1 unnamed protein product [Kuraishia capsulata CBS 1993]